MIFLPSYDFQLVKRLQSTREDPFDILPSFVEPTLVHVS